MAGYTGAYEINQQGTQAVINISAENSKLYLQSPTMGAQKLELYPLAAASFFMLKENAEISFVKDAQSVATKLRAQTANEDITAERMP